jgi:hypothetical protein
MDALAESAFETIGVEQPHRGGDRVAIDLAHHLDGYALQSGDAGSARTGCRSRS